MSAVIEMNCPHCQQVIRTNARYAGMQGPCPHCGKTIKVEASVDQVFELVLQQRSTTASTDANALVAGLIASVACLAFYAFFFLLRDTYVGDLFTRRGPIPFIATFVTCWGMAILVLKYIAVKQQMSFAEMEMDFIPLQKGMQIDSENVDGFLQHLDGIPQRARDSILGRRIRGALEHLRSRNSVPEVQAYLASQAEIDASGVDSGYTLVRAFIWAVPILGFIGTVMGISAAVSGLADSLDTAGAPTVAEAGVDETSNSTPAPSADEASVGSQMIGAMGVVTQGLATAFDTTFLALVMAILLLFPTESLKRVEYGMLDHIEGFTNDALLRRMSDKTADQSLSPEVARLIEPVFKRHQQWLMEWQSQVGQLGRVIGSDFELHVKHAQDQLTRASEVKVNDAGQAVEQISRAVGDLNQCLMQFRELSDQTTQSLKSTIDNTLQLQERLAENSQQVRSLAGQMEDIVPGDNTGEQQLVTAAASLERVAARLAELAAHSDSIPVANEDGRPSQDRGGIFGLFGKR